MTDLIPAYLAHCRAAGDSPKTLRLRKGVLRRLDRELPHGLLFAATQELEAWFGGGSWCAKTRSVYGEAARSFYHFACAGADPYLTWNPMLDLPHTRYRRRLPRPATEDQIRLALARLTGPARLAVLIAVHTGMRVGEIAGALREHFTERQVYIPHGKGDRDRYIPIHPEVWAAVADLPPGPIMRPEHPHGGTRLSAVDWLSRLVSRQLHAIGLRLTCHNFRHSFATTLMREDVNVRKVQQLMGHASLATTERYMLVTTEDLDEAIARLPSYASNDRPVSTWPVVAA